MRLEEIYNVLVIYHEIQMKVNKDESKNVCKFIKAS